MPNQLLKADGKATIAGTTIISAVPVGTTLTIISAKASNLDALAGHQIEFYSGGTLVNGLETEVPVGSSLDICNAGKFVMVAGDDLVAVGDTDNDLDIYVSYLEQT